MKALYVFIFLLVSASQSIAKTHDSIMSLKGPDSVYVNIFSKYVDDSITIFKPYSTYHMKIIVVKNLATNVIGKYYYSYIASDSSRKIQDTITRVILVRDLSGPLTIILKGSATVNICRWAKYVDAGYTIAGIIDTTKKIKVDTIGDFYSAGGTNLPGVYELGYIATDYLGRVSNSGYRYIVVLSNSAYSCQSGITPNLSLDQSISVFPNPSSGSFFVSSISTKKIFRIAVYNINGRLIKELNPDTTQFGNAEIDLSSQAAGIYFVHIQTSEGSIVRKVVLSK